MSRISIDRSKNYVWHCQTVMWYLSLKTMVTQYQNTLILKCFVFMEAMFCWVIYELIFKFLVIFLCCTKFVWLMTEQNRDSLKHVIPAYPKMSQVRGQGSWCWCFALRQVRVAYFIWCEVQLCNPSKNRKVCICDLFC